METIETQACACNPCTCAPCHCGSSTTAAPADDRRCGCGPDCGRGAGCGCQPG